MNARTMKLAVTGAGAAALAAAYAAVIRPWHLRWGATDEEAEMRLPGDELVDTSLESATHAITIHAPAERVWPWLAQIGQGRGGFYSYAALENAVGCRMRNAEVILPQLQEIRAGDPISFHPKAPTGMAVHVEPNRALVISDNHANTWTWGLYLKPIDERTTRLIIRARGRLETGPLGSISHYLLMEPAHFIMERKMMLTIKHLAEGVSRELK